MAEEFGLSPSEARHELETDPERLAERIMRLRAYARTKEAIDAADRPDSGLKAPTGRMAALVRKIGFEIYCEDTGTGEEDES